MTRELAPPMTLLDVFADFGRAKAYIFTGIILGAALAALFLFMATPHFKAQMVVEPANPMAGSEVSSVLANDDDLSSLRFLIQQVSVPNSADFMRFETTVTGPSVAAMMLKDGAIVKGLPIDDWNPQKLSAYVKKKVRIEPIGQTPQRRLTYFHPDSGYATYFLQRLHDLTDTRIRANIAVDATRRLKYLNETLRMNGNPDHKRAITNLMMEQERLLMLVSIDQPYAASIVEPAASSAKPEWPDKKLIFAGFILGGAVIGFVLYGLRHGSGR